MRILHTSDWHLGKTLENHTRYEEQEKFLEDFIKLAEERDVDLVIIAGDVYDNGNPPARAEQLFYDTLKRLSRGGRTLTLAVAGNHDSAERLTAATPLAREHGILLVGTPKTVIPVGAYGNHKVVASREGMVEIEINGERAVILTIAYPSEKNLNEVLYAQGSDEDEDRLAYGDRLKQLFDYLATFYRKDTINLMVAHLYAMGSEESGSERSIQLGGSYSLPGSFFPKACQYIALGHIHKPQVVPSTQKRAYYSGSPIHYNKKEIAYTKKCLLVDVVADTPCQIEEIPLPVYKPIEIWRCKSVEEAIEKCELNQDRSCWVYIEIDTDRIIREDESKQMKDLKKDILEIAPRGVYEDEETEEDGLPLIEQSFEEIFCKFYEKERGVRPEKEILEMLLKIVAEEEENDATDNTQN